MLHIYIKVFLIPEAFKATFSRSTEKDFEQLVMEWFRFANVRKQKKGSMLNPDIIISLNSFSVLINYFKYSYKCILHKLKLNYYKFFNLIEFYIFQEKKSKKKCNNYINIELNIE